MSTLYTSGGYYSTYDGDSTDLVVPNYVYAGYGSDYGHTDSYGDIDYEHLYVSTTGYYNLNTTISTGIGGIYDYTAGAWVTGTGYNNYMTGLYLYSSHTYDVGVLGSTVGQTYSVSVDPTYSSGSGGTWGSIPGGTTGGSTSGTTYSSALNLYASSIAWSGDCGTIYPDSSSPTYTVYGGYTDWSGDDDYAEVWNTSSRTYTGYSTGNTYIQFYDSSTSQWVGTGGYEYASAYLVGSHYNYLIAVGYTTGQSYSVSAY